MMDGQVIKQIKKDKKDTHNPITPPIPNDKVNYPGIWHCIHSVCINVTTQKDLDAFVFMLESIIPSLTCLECMMDASAYVKHHPPTLKGKSMFEWSVDFHNSVNHKLKKKTFTYEEAHKMYPQVLNKALIKSVLKNDKTNTNEALPDSLPEPTPKKYSVQFK